MMFFEAKSEFDPKSTYYKAELNIVFNSPGFPVTENTPRVLVWESENVYQTSKSAIMHAEEHFVNVMKLVLKGTS